MREEYIRKVKKKLALSRRQKAEILRDLSEAFDSAAEHGETEAAVIGRLGSPEDFAVNMEETLGVNRAQSKMRKRKLWTLCLCGVAVICFAGAILYKSAAVPDSVIGQEDAMTLMTVSSPFHFNPFIVLLIAGLLFAVAAIILTVGTIRGKKPNPEETK